MQKEYKGSKLFATKIFNNFGKECFEKPRVYKKLDDTMKTYHFITSNMMKEKFEEIVLV